MLLLLSRLETMCGMCFRTGSLMQICIFGEIILHLFTRLHVFFRFIVVWSDSTAAFPKWNGSFDVRASSSETKLLRPTEYNRFRYFVSNYKKSFQFSPFVLSNSKMHLPLDKEPNLSVYLMKINSESQREWRYTIYKNFASQWNSARWCSVSLPILLSTFQLENAFSPYWWMALCSNEDKIRILMFLLVIEH